MSHYRKTEKRIIQEQRRQLKMINCAAFTALFEMGWDADRIVERFNDTTDIYHELRDTGKTAFELLEDETEIELMLDGEKGWRELDFFNHSGRTVTIPQYIYTLNHRERFIIPQILATLLIAIHRIDHYDYDQLSNVITAIDNIRKECGQDLKAYVERMKTTGYTPALWGD